MRKPLLTDLFYHDCNSLFENRTLLNIVADILRVRKMISIHVGIATTVNLNWNGRQSAMNFAVNKLGLVLWKKRYILRPDRNREKNERPLIRLRLIRSFIILDREQWLLGASSTPHIVPVFQDVPGNTCVSRYNSLNYELSRWSATDSSDQSSRQHTSSCPRRESHNESGCSRP